MLDTVVARDKMPVDSLDIWSQALANARTPQGILVSCNQESMQYWEEAGSRGLEHLKER
jgi:hypothetical protein